MSKATIIVIFISNNSVDRRGYVQREIKLALDQKQEKLADDIYIIPVLLDDNAAVPLGLSELQFVKLSDGSIEDKLDQAISHQLQRLGIQKSETEVETGIRWYSVSLHEEKDGIPGYEADFQYLKLSSERYPEIAEVNNTIKSDIYKHLMCLREQSLEPDTPYMNFGQEKYSRTNTIDISYAQPVLVGRVLSLVASVHWYSAGAAHPNHGYQTYCYVIDPLIDISSPASLFVDEDKALEAVQAIVRKEILGLHEDDEQQGLLDPDWVNSGTEDWSAFGNFTIYEDGIEFLFPPYQVGPYAAGPISAKVPFEAIHALIKPIFRSLLEIEYRFTS